MVDGWWYNSAILAAIADCYIYVHRSQQVTNPGNSRTLLKCFWLAAGNSNAAVALLLKGGLVLHPEKYLRYEASACNIEHSSLLTLLSDPTIPVPAVLNTDLCA